MRSAASLSTSRSGRRLRSWARTAPARRHCSGRSPARIARPAAVESVYRSLGSLIESGATMLLVEQDLARAMSVASRVVCMLEGRIVLVGGAGELTREQVTDAYFGLKAAAA